MSLSIRESYPHNMTSDTVSLILSDVVALYLRDEDMEVDELERMVDVAIRGGIPKHPRLRVRDSSIFYLPFPSGGMVTRGELC